MLLDELRTLEIALHRPEVRTNVTRLRALLHPDFMEIGYSGKTYDFGAIVASLSSSAPGLVVWSQDFECHEFAPNIAQLIYRSAHVDENDALSRYTRRSSIWLKTSAESWQMRFHQGTPVPAVPKAMS